MIGFFESIAITGCSVEPFHTRALCCNAYCYDYSSHVTKCGEGLNEQKLGRFVVRKKS